MLDQFRSLIEQNAARFDVPIAWIQAVIMTESSGRVDAYRAEPRINDASYGLMQLLLRTARGLGYTGDASGLFDPATNIRLGTQLLADLRRRYGTDFDRVYSAYNSGSPDRYLTSTQVATHVANARRWLQRVSRGKPDADRKRPSSTSVARRALVEGEIMTDEQNDEQRRAADEEAQRETERQRAETRRNESPAQREARERDEAIEESIKAQRDAQRTATVQTSENAERKPAAVFPPTSNGRVGD